MYTALKVVSSEGSSQRPFSTHQWRSQEYSSSPNLKDDMHQCMKFNTILKHRKAEFRNFTYLIPIPHGASNQRNHARWSIVLDARKKPLLALTFQARRSLPESCGAIFDLRQPSAFDCVTFGSHRPVTTFSKWRRRAVQSGHVENNGAHWPCNRTAGSWRVIFLCCWLRGSKGFRFHFEAALRS